MLLHKRFIENAKKYSSKQAIIDIATGKNFTYSEALIASIMLSDKFKKFPEQNIGVMLPTSAGCILSFIALLFSGKTPVMINYATGAEDNCLYAQEKCIFSTIITSKKLLAKVNCKHVEGMVYIEDILKSVNILDKIKSAARSKLPAAFMGVHGGKTNDNALILFTSGSEKAPKAVQLTHKNILANTDVVPFSIKTDHHDTYGACLPYFHVFGLTVTFWLPIILGATIVAMPNPIDYKGVCDTIKKHKINVIVGTPTFFHGYLRRAERDTFRSVRLAIAGADKLPKKLHDDFLHHHDVKILEGYGTTETSPVISVNPVGKDKLGSVGLPLKGVKVRIINIDTDEILPPGKVGKIMVKGDLVMKGYYDDIEETSMRIHNGWYDTGDMGMLDKDGYLWHKGRLKRFTKIGGEMVSMVKIENALEDLLPEDATCCVVDVPNPAKGADIVAAVTTKEVNVRKLKKQLSKQLSSIEIPREFYIVDDLPLMSSGKVDFRSVEKICKKLHNSKVKKKHK